MARKGREWAARLTEPPGRVPSGSVGTPEGDLGATLGRLGSWLWTVSLGGSVVSPGAPRAVLTGLGWVGWEPGRLRALAADLTQAVFRVPPRLGFQTLLKLLLG